MPKRAGRKKPREPTRQPGSGRHPTQPLSARGQRALNRVRKICLALPETTEKEAWGAPTFRVRDKLFCHFRDNHHGDGRIALWCKSTHDEQDLLVESQPSVFFIPAYVGPSGWVGIDLDSPDWALASEILTNAYRMNASKRQIELLDKGR